MRMFRVALLTIVGLETTQIPLSSRVDEQAVAVWSQDEILYSNQNEWPVLTCHIMPESWQQKIEMEKSLEILYPMILFIKLKTIKMLK